MPVPPFRVVLKTPVDSALHGCAATMASADSCTFSTALRQWLLFSEHLVQVSPGTTRFFSSIYLPHLLHLSPCSYGLQLVTQSYPQMQPYMRFLYVRPEVCPRVSRFPESGFLQIPSHDEHPCLRLYPSRYRADS